MNGQQNIKKKNTSVVILVFYGHETWFVSQRERHRLSMLDSEVLRIIFGSNKGGNSSRLEDIAMGVVQLLYE